MNKDVTEPQEYLAILKRRKWQFAVPALVLFVLSVGVAMMWPPVFRASALILIEEPDVPRDLVQSTVSSYAAERIQIITQRVMTTKNLARIIQQYDLFTEKRERVSMNSVVANMRQDVGLELINANVIDPRSGRPTSATIAFRLTFEHRSAATSQRVLNDLVSLYMSENLRARKKKASETTKFLAAEAAKYNDLVNQFEAERAEFKKHYAGILPVDLPVNLQSLERIERDLLETRRELQALTERRIYLDSQLAQVNPHALPLNSAGAVVMRPEERLAMQEAKLLGLRSIYGAAHPDVRKLTREVNSLKKKVGKTDGVAELEQTRDLIVTELAAARERYSDAHPDVLKLMRQLESLRAALSKARLTAAEPERPEIPSNPAYLQLAAQLETVNSDARARRQQQKRLRENRAALEQKIAKAPQVEREYLLLQRNYENALVTYREMKSKLTSAEIGESLETERKSERFTLNEPPTLPDKPVKPNRLAILFIGFVFSLAAGAGSAALFESLDQSIYGLNQLIAVTGAAPLVVVPHIQNRQEIRGNWARNLVAPLAAVTVVAGGVFVVNEFFLPLDVFWAIAERRVELLLIDIGII